MSHLQLTAILGLLQGHAIAVAACTARLAPIAMLCPVLGGQASGQLVKLSTCLALAIGAHVAGGIGAPPLNNALQGAALLIREALFGVAIGLVVGLAFDAARIGGRFIDMVRGTSAEAALPFAGSREAASGDALYQLLVALAASGGAASIVISGALRSFAAVPLGAFGPSQSLGLYLATLLGTAVATGLCVAAPIVACALAVDAAIGLASRAAGPVSLAELAAPAKILGGALLWLSIGIISERLLAGVYAAGPALTSLFGTIR